MGGAERGSGEGRVQPRAAGRLRADGELHGRRHQRLQRGRQDVEPGRAPDLPHPEPGQACAAPATAATRRPPAVHASQLPAAAPQAVQEAQAPAVLQAAFLPQPAPRPLASSQEAPQRHQARPARHQADLPAPRRYPRPSPDEDQVHSSRPNLPLRSRRNGRHDASSRALQDTQGGLR